MSAKPTPMTLAAARVLCKQHAKLTNTDADDCWAIYHRSFVEDAEKALEAAGAPGLYEVVVKLLQASDQAPDALAFSECVDAFIEEARAAIARATGRGEVA